MVNPVQAEAAQKMIATFLCPSDAANPRFANFLYYSGQTATSAGTNYVVCSGSGTGTSYDLRYPSDGMAWNDSAVRFADIADGTSHTMLMSESILGNDTDLTADAPTDPRRQMASMCSQYSLNAGGPGLAGVENPDVQALVAGATYWRGCRGATWIWGRPQVNCFSAYMPPNTPVPDMAARGVGFFAARSNHPGGVNVLLVDGSVHFLEENIVLAAWRAMSTRAGGELVAGGELE